MKYSIAALLTVTTIIAFFLAGGANAWNGSRAMRRIKTQQEMEQAINWVSKVLQMPTSRLPSEWADFEEARISVVRSQPMEVYNSNPWQYAPNPIRSGKDAWGSGLILEKTKAQPNDTTDPHKTQVRYRIRSLGANKEDEQGDGDDIQAFVTVTVWRTPE